MVVAGCYDFPSNATRPRQLKEVVQIFKLMWTEEHPTFAGKHLSLDNAGATRNGNVCSVSG